VPDAISIPGKPYVINRTARMLGNHRAWDGMLRERGDQCVFVGLPKEHEIFEYAFERQVAYRATGDILELARVIAGCVQFMGNASLAHGIAEAMKKPMIVEIDRVVCAIMFERENVQYV